MRQNVPQKRGRGRPGGRRPFTGNSNRTLDSSGPDVKIRGTAMYIYDRYQQLARDATSTGDRIAAENYLQHAEHYYRLMVAQGLLNPQNGGANRPDGEDGQPEPEGQMGQGNGQQPGMADGVGGERANAGQANPQGQDHGGHGHGGHGHGGHGHAGRGHSGRDQGGRDQGGRGQGGHDQGGRGQGGHDQGGHGHGADAQQPDIDPDKTDE